MTKHSNTNKSKYCSNLKHCEADRQTEVSISGIRAGVQWVLKVWVAGRDSGEVKAIGIYGNDDNVDEKQTESKANLISFNKSMGSK